MLFETKRPKKDAGKSHVVLVHGVCHNIWVWSLIMQALADTGFATAAVNLKHGIQGRWFWRIWAGLGTYAKQVVTVIEIVAGNEPVVLVGHSMGASVCRLVARLFPGKVKGLVLIAPSHPPYILRSVMQTAWKNPLGFIFVNLFLNLKWLVAFPSWCRKMFFTTETQERMVNWVHGLMEDESWACFAGIILEKFHHRSWKPDCPTLVIAAKQDAIFRHDYVQAEAERLGAELREFDCGHDELLMGSYGNQVAYCLITWISSL